MSSPNTHSQDQYPTALKVIRQITNLTGGQDCIFRGESKLYDYPCSSGFYRELKDNGVTDGDMPTRLKERQDELVIKLRKEDGRWETDLEKLMAHQHIGETTNLLDFAGDLHVALFFACSQEKNSDGQVIVKKKGAFRELDRGTPLVNDEIVLLQPPDLLLPARDQRAVLLHVPNGTLPVETEETVLIKREFKEEILELLEKVHGVSPETMLGGIGKQIEQQSDEVTQVDGPTESNTRLSLKGFATPEDSEDILTMQYYMKLLKIPAKGPYKKFLRGHADALIESFTENIGLGSDAAETFYNRAFVHQSKPNPDYERAISDYTHAIKWKPDYTDAYSNRGTAYLTKSTPDYERAILDFTRAIELNPDYVEGYTNRGSAYNHKSNPDYERAIQDYTRALEINPDDAVAYYNRGVSYRDRRFTYSQGPASNYEREVSDCESEIADYTCAIELDPEFALAYNNRGNVYMRNPKPDYDSAISDFTRAIELNPDDAMLYSNRGLAYAENPKPDYDSAIKNYNRALELNPNSAMVYYNRGNVYKDRPAHDYKRALLDYDRAIELNPNFAVAYNNRGIVYRDRPNS